MSRVLIVDDKDENLYYLQALLTGHGWDVEIAHHGAEALVKARRHPPALVVSDLLMPVMDGYTMLRHWRADPTLACIPFVVYTATYTAVEDEQLAYALGADAFLLKPAEPEEFLARIAEVMSRARAATAAPGRPADGDEAALLEVYSATLIRKLEERTLQLEDANRALQQDIAAREAAEADLRRAQAQLLRTQRLESIGTLASGIAHDLNNVLAPIILSIELLKMDSAAADRDELLSTIDASAKRGAEMVRQVLSFARGVEGRRVPVRVGGVIAEIEKMANDTFLKNIQVRTAVPGDLPPISGDPTQLHQVLLNLCVNSRDAMPDGGVLSMTAWEAMVDATQAAAHPGARPGPHVVIQVEDSGAGMPPAVLDRIFEPFFTTKEAGCGTGLGLPTSRAIVGSHHGFMEVSSRPGEGTRFRVYLPADAPAAEVPRPAPVDLPRGSGEVILVVDDEPSARETTRQALEAFGYRVLLAEDGAAAVSIFSRERRRVALVLVDMMMPLMDGPATIEVLLRIDPHARVVLTSGFSVDGRPAREVSPRVKQFLPKPYTAEALLRAIESALRDPAA